MKNQSHGKTISEGLGNTQVRSGLHRIIALHSTHNPGREERAGQPEQRQPKNPRSHANLRGQWASETTISNVQGGGM